MSNNSESPVVGIRDRLRKAPEGKTVFRRGVESRQVEAYRSEIKARDFTVVIDEPEAFGSTNAGPTPLEMMMAAFAACQEVTYRLHATLLDIPLEKVSVSISGAVDQRGLFGVSDDVPSGLQDVRVSVSLVSSASAEQIARLNAAVDKYCPVLDSLRRPTETTTEVSVTAP